MINANANTVLHILAASVAAYRACVEENNPFAQNHEDNILFLQTDYLPSGSGFDQGTKVDIVQSTHNKIIISTAYHHMDDAGGYCGWVAYVFSIQPDLLNGFIIKMEHTDDNRMSYVKYEDSEDAEYIPPDHEYIMDTLYESLNTLIPTEKDKKYEYVIEAFQCDSSIGSRIIYLTDSNLTYANEAIIDKITYRWPNKPDKEYAKLLEIDFITGSYGVETLIANDAYNEPVYNFIYINVGDTYKGTIIYDYLKSEFIYNSWGDYVEKLEKEQEVLENLDHNDDIPF